MLAAALATVTSRARLGLTVDAEDRRRGARTPPPDSAAAVAGPRRAARLHRPASGAAARLARTVDGCRLLGAGGRGRLAGAQRGDRRARAVGSAIPAEDRARLDRARDARRRRALVDARWSAGSRSRCRTPGRLAADWCRLQAAGADGLLVPLDARLVDLLRRFDEEDDRSDLTLVPGLSFVVLSTVGRRPGSRSPGHRPALSHGIVEGPAGDLRARSPAGCRLAGRPGSGGRGARQGDPAPPRGTSQRRTGMDLETGRRQ